MLTEGILGQLATKHDITLFTASFPGASDKEIINGYTVIRKGSPYTVHFWAFVYWWKYFRKENFDVVIDQIHGIPFFTSLYIRRVKVIAFIHEVAHDIWTQMYPFPWGAIGKFLEPWIFRIYRKTKFITVSNSTKQDLIAIGIPESNIAITPEAIDDEMFVPVNYSKEPNPTLISIGRLAPMKRPEHVIEAFKVAQKEIPNLQLWIVGDGEEQLRNQLLNSAEGYAITFFGKVDTEKKKELLSRAWMLVSCSLKEGFGLVVLEAAAMGIPSIVYDIPGFRDSVKSGETGIICKANPSSMAQSIVELINDKEMYLNLRKNCAAYSQQFNFEKASRAFVLELKNVY